MLLSELNSEDLKGKENIERVGLAWVRLNRFQWDEILGDKPNNFDNIKCRSDIVSHKMKEIEYLLGTRSDAITSWCWWKYELNKTFEEWINWYLYSEHLYK